MRYAGKLRLGAIYRSVSTPETSRRITKMRFGCVYYVLYQQDKRPIPECAATESMFRDFTLHEIKPEDM